MRGHDEDNHFETLADAFLQLHATKVPSDEEMRVLEEVWDTVRDEPDRGLELTLLLVKKAGDNDRVLAYVAAGPLEDLLKLHGPAVIDRIERESENDSRLQLALTGVWGLHGPVLERWSALMRRWGFADGKRAAL